MTLSILAGCCLNAQVSAADQLQALPFGSVKPQGWLETQMRRDIDVGFVGALDKLVPDLIQQDDIYGDDRLTKKVQRKDVGTHTTGSDWEVQFLWWNSETQSNWWDGYLRNILLLQHDDHMEKVRQYVQTKLTGADKNGYIGIYEDDLRYAHSTENGELWAQSSLFRGLLAYYEATKDKKVLDAVVKAVQLTMQAYPINASEPFKVKDAFAGVGHGLTFVDVLNTLHRITGEQSYIDYAIFLYDDYSRHPQPEQDIQPKNLLNPEYRFKGHGVHTYEHLRALSIAAFHSNDEKYADSLTAYLSRLENVITASGGPIGDEWIGERHAHHSHTGYEYCSIQELFHSYAVLLQKTGAAKWADKMEWLLYNAGQGARHPNGKAVAYCQSDNSSNMLGHLDMDNPQGEMRFKFSAAHQDVAVCCAPNAGRIYPYFTQNIWQQKGHMLVAALYGPSRLETDIAGTKVSIEQVTEYPFEHQIRFEVQVSKPVKFVLGLRMPNWADSATLNGEPVQVENGFILIEKVWQGKQDRVLKFEDKPRVVTHTQNTAGVHYGPLLYALPLGHKQSPGRQYPVEGFVDQFYQGTESHKTQWQIQPDTSFTVAKEAGISWDGPKLLGSLMDPAKGQSVAVELVPMGSTILRHVSFDIAR